MKSNPKSQRTMLDKNASEYVKTFKREQEAKNSVINLRKFLSEIDKQNSKHFTEVNIQPVKIWLDDNNTHFMERINSRGIDKGHLGTALKRLITEKLCFMTFMFERNYMFYKSGQKNSSTFYINLKYKSVNIVLMCKKVGNVRRIIPKTVLTNNMNAKADEVIDLN